MCNHNKFGFCKFKKTFRKQHVGQLCEISSCDVLTCTLRHPKVCRYYRDFNKCKFSEWCAFAHVDKEDPSKNHKLEIERLLVKITDIEKASVVKDEQIENLKMENEKINKYSRDCGWPRRP